MVDEFDPTMEDLDAAHRSFSRMPGSGPAWEMSWVMGRIEGVLSRASGDPAGVVREARALLAAYRARSGIVLPDG